MKRNTFFLAMSVVVMLGMLLSACGSSCHSHYGTHQAPAPTTAPAAPAPTTAPPTSHQPHQPPRAEPMYWCPRIWAIPILTPPIQVRSWLPRSWA